MEITIRVIWKGKGADPNNPKPLSVPKVRVQTGSGNWSIPGNRTSNPVTVEGETFTDKAGTESSKVVSAMIAAMMGGNFSNVRSNVVDDNKKLMFSQALRIKLTWPNNARADDKLTLGNRDQKLYPSFIAGSSFPR